MICSNCGSEVQDGMKFCFDCGTPVPQVKKCVSCGAELSLKMKFCPECGTNQDGSAPKSSGFSMGDKNVIAGDVIGNKEETHISGNATIIKNEDQTKQVKKCHICGSFVSIVDGYDCPECGEFTCEDCFDSTKIICKSCAKNKLQNNEEKFIEALNEFLKDGIIDVNERKEIESLKVKYGISTEKANALEQELKPKTEKINFSTIEKLNLDEATEVFYEEGDEKKAYELLEPIYKAHPYSEEILNIYLPVLIKTDIEEAKKIISKTNIDILSMCMAEIEIAIIEKDLDLAERKINQAKQLWQSNKLKYYEAWFYLELAKFTGKDTFVSNAEEIANNFDKTEDKLELSYQIKILKNIAEYKGEDTSFYTEDFCKENNLYTSVVLGVPQTKRCINCGLELPLSMKFCGECGTKQDGSAPKSSGFSMGDKNVIAGDVIGSKEETNISGNATIIKNEDQTKQVKKCHICGSFIPVVDGYNCPECEEFTCEDCFDLSKRICKSCEKK